jgi:AcrR family transcriptional regulator
MDVPKTRAPAASPAPAGEAGAGQAGVRETDGAQAGVRETDGAPAGGGVRRRAGRPRHVVLDRDIIARAALDLVTEAGYEALTMAALARRLGVSASALYNHVDSKQELLQGIQDLVMVRVDRSAFTDRPLDAALRIWATSYRNVFAGHAPLIPVIAVLPVTGSPRTLRMYEAVAAGFQRAGWERSRIVPAIVAIESFIFGSALDAVAPADIFDTGPHGRDVPVFADAVRAQRETGEGSADAAFGVGLRALVAGLLAAGPRA